MLTVKRFLCCFSLNFGGKVIGCLTLLINVGLLVLSVGSIVALSAVTCKEIEDFIYKEQQEVERFDEYCEIGKTVAIVLIKMAALLSLACAVIGYLCIIGTKKRKPGHIKPMVALLAACTIHGFLNFLSFSVFGVTFGMITGCIGGYLLVCVYSLHSKIKEELNEDDSDSTAETEGTVTDDPEKAVEDPGKVSDP